MELRPGLAAVALAASPLLLSACGSGSSSSASTPTALPPPPPPVAMAYNGPGSKWNVDLSDDGTFVIERRPSVSTDVDLTVNGTYVEQSNGFLRMTVTTASGDDAPEQGETAWAIEVEGYALFLKPDDNPDGQFIAMVDAGNCPSADFIGNWVTVKTRVGADATDPDQDFLGSFAFSAETNAGSLPSRYSLADGFPSLGANEDIGAGVCADGIMEVDDAVMYLTANGGGLVHTNQSDPDEANIIFAMPQQTLDSIDLLDAEYAGLLFDASPSEDPDVQPAIVSCSAGLCGGGLYDDVMSTEPHVEFSISLSGTLDFPERGFISGTVTSGGELGNITCLVNTDLGGAERTLMSCVGQSPGNPTQMFNLMLRSI